MLVSVLFFSCSSDSDGGVKSSENYIESFSYPGINHVQINIINEQNTVHVLTNQNISGIEPAIVPSKGASIKKEGDKYTVTAENGEARTYSVVISERVENENHFEDWSSNGYYFLSDLNWTSGNAGISTALQMFGKDKSDPENYPTKKTGEGYNGSAVVLETIKGGKIFNRDMPILSGNFFLGNFNTSKMVSDELAATEFGKLYFVKPKKITGYYKYKEGEGDSMTDFCDIYAAFYQAENDRILTAKERENLASSPYVLAYARWQDCSATDGDGFHPFELIFDYKSEPDFINQNYKLLITFASSVDGDTYKGKIGSKLTVDEVKIEDY